MNETESNGDVPSPAREVPAGDRQKFTAERPRPARRWQFLALCFVLAVSTLGVAAWAVRAHLRTVLAEKLHAHGPETTEEPAPRQGGRRFPEEFLSGPKLHNAQLPPPEPTQMPSQGMIERPAERPPLPAGLLTAAANPTPVSLDNPLPSIGLGNSGTPPLPTGLVAQAGGPMAAPGRPSMMVEAAAGGPSAQLQAAAEPLRPAEIDEGRGFQKSLAGSRFPEARATQLGARDLLLARGAYVPCVLETQLVSNIAGFVSCIVTDNIFSDNGHTLLIERGTHVSGEYQSNLRNGDTRLFVVWNRLKTPNGVVVALDSPGGDAVGGQGLPGAIENHWWDRIGAAFLLSIFQDGIAIELARQTSQNASTVTTINTTPTNTVGAAQDLSKEILSSTINVPPTIYKNRGELLTIYVARDLRFDDVYRLR